jgi:hypothetical protein
MIPGKLYKTYLPSGIGGISNWTPHKMLSRIIYSNLTELNNIDWDEFFCNEKEIIPFEDVVMFIDSNSYLFHKVLYKGRVGYISINCRFEQAL